MAQQQIMIILTDLDRANCVVEFRNQWLGRDCPDNLLLRVAVREVESWVLADHTAMRELVGMTGTLPANPDELSDPKQTLLQLAKGAPRPVRGDLLKIVGGNISPGLGYNARLTEWVASVWNPQRAAERSPSLARARLRLKEAVDTFDVSTFPS